MNRTFTLCFLLYPIALPFGYVLVYTFYHYAVPDANSNLNNLSDVQKNSFLGGWNNRSRPSYFHIIPNIGPRNTMKLCPTATKGEIVWVIFCSYPISALNTQVFIVTRDAKFAVISGNSPTITKVDSQSDMEGNVQVMFTSSYVHTFVFGSNLHTIELI